MKKVLVIGGTGTISTPVTMTLANDPDVELYVLNRGKKEDHLPADVHRLVGDIRNDAAGVKEVLKDLTFDSVINFVIMSLEDAMINVDLFHGKTKQFVFISTVCTLDHSTSCNVDETMPYGNAYYQYGRDKEACEKYFL